MECTVSDTCKNTGQSKAFFTNIFDTSDWPDRWHCGNWSDFHGWLYILSDLAIWMAYFAIPVILIYCVKKKGDVPFTGVFRLFGIFILLCGITHLVDAITFYYPLYRFNALLLFTTAVVSWMTVITLIKLMPQALALTTPAQLEEVVEKRTAELREKNSELRRKTELLNNSYEDLESKVKFRTMELEKEVARLKEENELLKGK
jgi:hypothetical protein